MATTAAFASPAGAAVSEDPKPRIINGTPTTTEEHPYMVFLSSDGTGAQQFCGGSLVAPNKVLTAAHCTVGSQPGDFKVVSGRTDKTTDEGVVSEVSEVWTHPDYDDANITSDVSVLTLAEDVPDAKPIEFAKAGDEGLYAPDTESLILGWGTTETGDTSDVLLQANVPMVSDEQCASSYGESFFPEHHACAGIFDTGGTDTCQGDSGGPLIVEGKIIGLTSWGQGCAEPKYPGVYSKVITYTDAIAEQVGGGSGS